jgi:hypothetical protein
VKALQGYDAVVLGSGIYVGQWLVHRGERTVHPYGTDGAHHRPPARRASSRRTAGPR